MTKYKRIIATILLLTMCISLFSGCGKDKKEINVYTQLRDLSEIKSFDYELNSKIYLTKTENVVIENKPTEPPVDSPAEEPENTETENEGIATADVEETEETTNPEETQPEEEPTKPTPDSEKKETVITETEYNVRLLGTYLAEDKWLMKVFVKDVNVKGYTNLTNIYRIGEDVYVDVYSMIDSLDYLLDANNNIKSQFDFENTRYIKTNTKDFHNVILSESGKEKLNILPLVQVMSSDLRDVLNKMGYSALTIDTTLDEAVAYAKELAQVMEAEKPENAPKDYTGPKYSGKDEEGNYTFTLNKENNAKAFIERYSQDLPSKLTPVTNGWFNNYITDLKTEYNEEETDTNVIVKTNITGEEGTRKAKVSLEYNKVKPMSTRKVSVTLKLTETNKTEIETPTGIIETEGITLSQVNNSVRFLLEQFATGVLGNEDNELTPEKIVALGKFVKPSQNDTFKYKIFDRYVSISLYIGKSADVTVPDTIDGLPVYVIEDEAFRKCDFLRSVNISDNVIQIGSNAFRDCKNLETINIPKNLTDIPNSMCENCEKLEDFDIPVGVKTIGNSAFRDCATLTKVVLPKTVNLVNNSAFSGCVGLQYIVAMDGKVYDEEGVYLRTVALSIKTNAFNGHSAKTVILPNTVVEIARGAFKPDKKIQTETMYYGYTPSELNQHCADNKYKFTSILVDGDIDKALREDMEKAIEMAKQLS